MSRFPNLSGVPDFRAKSDYQVLSSAKKIPSSWFINEDLVIERFTPELHDGLHVLREWYFLGDAEFLRVETARYAVITSGENRPDLVRPIPENLRELRRKWKINYGKIDFVIRDGEAVVFDVNKTPSLGSEPKDDATRELIAALAGGITSFLR